MKPIKTYLSLLFFCIGFLPSLAQTGPCPYEQKMKQQGLVEVQKVLPSVFVQLKYATPDNL